ncbi:DUF1761 family protein [Pontibacillus salicampi]|uniref:DUF1761 family protein n=1 Tax=Pontibacillus salicampi TaxID=1449801 RepID=A0ABV6LUA8_9BACI
MFIPIIIGAVLYMLYGGIYYSILLSDKQADKNKDIQLHQTEGAMKYITSVLIAFISSTLVAIAIKQTGLDTITGGLSIGLLLGIIISLVYLKNALFGLMPRRSLYIAIGDHLVIFTLLGLLHGWLA